MVLIVLWCLCLAAVLRWFESGDAMRSPHEVVEALLLAAAIVALVVLTLRAT